MAPDYRWLHFACHGKYIPSEPLASALQIGADDWLTGAEILQHLRLHADLVVLSACESGVNFVRRGDELYGLVRAFLLAGAKALLVTLWRVDERPTLLLMHHFYQVALADPHFPQVDFAAALKAAQLYLQTLTRRQAANALSLVLPDFDPTELDQFGAAADDLIFAAPKQWAAFVLIGDPWLVQPTESDLIEPGSATALSPTHLST